MLELDDSILLKEYIEHGSEEAFATLVARHVNKVYSIALRHTRNAHQAEEITQAVFVILARKSRQLGERVILSGWLCRTARLSAVTFVRSEIRRTRREQEAHMQNLLNESESEVWPQIAPLLDAAMAGLSEADHDAVALRFFDGKSMKEIGAVLGASEDAAKVRVSRAVEKLRIFFTRRGIVCSAAALTAAISANAVHAAPVGLAVKISTAAVLSGTAIATTATTTATNAIALLTAPKALVAGIAAVALTAGVGTYVIQQVTAAPPVAAQAADSEYGILKTPDGKPLPNADVYLSTASVAVPVYAAPPPKVAITRTGADGQFSFPLAPENRAVIVVHEKGYGQITVAELVKRHELTLQPWGRVEGTLREGSTPLAGETIHLSRAAYGSEIERRAFRTDHDTTTQTDAAGHYVFPRVAPGNAWISWLTDRRQRAGSTNKYDVQTRYVDIQSGQSHITDIGGRGRPIIGRAVLAESAPQVRHFGVLHPKTNEMRRPPNWPELSTEEKTAFTVAWEKSPEGKLYKHQQCVIRFRPAEDGTFIVPDVPAGEYRLWLGGWDAPTAPMMQISRGDLLVTVPEMPGGRSDEPLDVGEIKTYGFMPLKAGEPAPLFEASTFDGKPLKLADFKGKHVLLNFWRSADAKSLADMAHLKAAQAAWGKDPRFVLIGLNLDGTLAAAQQYAADNKLTWVQCYLGERSEVHLRYHLLNVLSKQTWDSGPKSVLIGPDGLIIRDLRGPKIAPTLEQVLSTRVKTRITQPGDLIFASSRNSRGSEGAASAIDNNKNTKYLNHDSGRDGFLPSGFAIQPTVGPTVVTGIGIQCANDASDRDPDVVVLEGSNDTELIGYESGTWTPITTISNIAAGFTARFESQEFFFSNAIPYRNYRWRVEATRIMPNKCCMQVAEVWLTTSSPATRAGSPAARD
jgi:RNA polymerase sigma factor (sigma-70 family)